MLLHDERGHLSWFRYLVRMHAGCNPEVYRACSTGRGPWGKLAGGTTYSIWPGNVPGKRGWGEGCLENSSWAATPVTLACRK